MPHFIKKPMALRIQAGTDAIAHIRQYGLQAADIDIIPGAAGGPKGIGLCGLDQAIFGSFLAQSPKKRTYIGSSIGSWRFAAIAAHGAQRGPELLAQLYNNIGFFKGMKARDVSASCQLMLNQLLAGKSHSLLDHPDMHLVVMMVKCNRLLSSDRPFPLGLALTGVYGGNLLSRRSLSLFMQRCYAYSHEADKRLANITDSAEFGSQHINMTADNLMDILMASASIPLVMNGVADIPAVGKGIYRDGGMIDYHLDLPYNSQGLVLYPHFSDRITPGWFDKSVKWRRPNPLNHRRTVLISPSAGYLASLPLGRLPDRKDFNAFVGRDDERKKIWEFAIAESQRLGDEFLELLHHDSLIEHIEPLH